MPDVIEQENAAARRDARPVLAAFYAAQFAHMGIVMPFLAPWLASRGFTTTAIGALMALPPLCKLLAPWSWALWADRSGLRRELLVVASVIAAAALATATGVTATWLLVVLIAIYGFARAPLLPFAEATALEQLEQRNFAYGPVRLWGSVSFMLTSMIYGALHRPGAGDRGLLVASGMLAAGAVLAAVMPGPLPLERKRRSSGSVLPPGGERADSGALPRLIATCTLMQLSHGAYYSFYSIHLQQLGFDGGGIGALWAFGVFCEILLLTRLDRWVARFGSAAVMRASLLLAAVRWITIGTASSTILIVAAQALHAATYAAFHVAAIGEIYRRFGPEHRARGQAVYSGMTFGLGLMAGSLLGGWVASAAGLRAAFLVSAVLALAGLPALGRIDRRAGRA